MRKIFALSRIKIIRHPYSSFIFTTPSSYVKSQGVVGRHGRHNSSKALDVNDVKRQLPIKFESLMNRLCALLSTQYRLLFFHLCKLSFVISSIVLFHDSLCVYFSQAHSQIPNLVASCYSPDSVDIPKVKQLERTSALLARRGAGCFNCGSLGHLRRDCPQSRA
ncbi:hypothetical protein T4D_8430 [Trichinella pseudospiralis]|uniref:CCHC-type domain-containing protein n=1 Tax=Trichinella pseudospiralis TaxID=6337 RepID=A0A0V1G1S6_TRIPS|nr:hypothetical protein T4D_8430 [Trichinella pseudospiralis]